MDTISDINKGTRELSLKMDFFLKSAEAALNDMHFRDALSPSECPKYRPYTLSLDISSSLNTPSIVRIIRRCYNRDKSTHSRRRGRGNMTYLFLRLSVRRTFWVRSLNFSY